MRFGLVSLALSVIAIGACGEPHGKTDDPVACMAYLSLQSGAVLEGRAQGDSAALDLANAAWRTHAEQKYTADELAQYYASTVAVFDDASPEDLPLLAAHCASSAPQV